MTFRWQHYLSEIGLTVPRRMPATADAALAKAKEHFKATATVGNGELPSFGNRWGQFATEMSERIESFSSAAEAIDYAQLHGSFDHRGSSHSSYTRASLRVMRELLIQTHSEHENWIRALSDSPYSVPSSLVWMKTTGRKAAPASNMTFFHAVYVLGSLAHVPRVNTMLEIGGGYGGAARLWLSAPNPVKRLWLVDLPSSLFFAELFLRLNFPEAKFTYVSEEKTARETIETKSGADQEIILCPISIAPALEGIPCDLIVNTGSLAEVTDDWAAFWSEWLSSTNAAWFYSHNMFSTPIDSPMESRNPMAICLGADWRLKHAGSAHPIVVQQSHGRRFAELVFRRANENEPLPKALELFQSLEQYQLGTADLARMYYASLANPDASILEPLKARLTAELGYVPTELLHLYRHQLREDPDSPVAASITETTADLTNLYEVTYPRVLSQSSVDLRTNFVIAVALPEILVFWPL